MPDPEKNEKPDDDDTVKEDDSSDKPKEGEESNETEPKKVEGVPVEVELALGQIPPRSPDAKPAHEFAASLEGKTPAQIQEAIYKEVVEKGNVPDYLRTLKPFTFKRKDANGQEHEVTFFAMKGVMEIGSGKKIKIINKKGEEEEVIDSFTVPLTPVMAERIAGNNFMLPTADMLEQIYGDKDTKKIAMPVGAEFGRGQDYQEYMQKAEFLQKMDASEKQRYEALGLDKNSSVAWADRKEVCYSAMQLNGHLAFYGGLKADGSHIQGSDSHPHVAHEFSYFDYSHGGRLIARTIFIDGKPHDLMQVLRDPVLYKLVSSEGKIDGNQYGTVRSNINVSAYKLPSSVKSNPPADVEPKPNSTPEPAISNPEPVKRTATVEVQHPDTNAIPVSFSAPATNAPAANPPMSNPPSLPNTETNIPAPQPKFPEPVSTGENAQAKVAPVEDKSTTEIDPNVAQDTLFFGDSINEVMQQIEAQKIIKPKNIFALHGRHTTDVLASVQENSAAIKSAKRLVLLVGTNDVGAPAKTAKFITDHLLQIWQKIHEINPKIEIVVCTIPPFYGYKPYMSDFENLNKKRETVNNWIRSRAKEDGPPKIKLIDLAARQSEGGLADNKDPRKFAEGISEDGCHPMAQPLAQTYGIALMRMKKAES